MSGSPGSAVGSIRTTSISPASSAARQRGGKRFAIDACAGGVDHRDAPGRPGGPRDAQNPHGGAQVDRGLRRMADRAQFPGERLGAAFVEAERGDERAGRRGFVGRSVGRVRSPARTRRCCRRLARSRRRSPPSSARRAAADREAEPGAAIAVDDGLVGLGEALEDARPRLGRDADAGVRSPRSAAEGARRSRAPARRSTITPPRSVNFTALPMRLTSTSARCRRSPRRRIRRARGRRAGRGCRPLARA